MRRDEIQDIRESSFDEEEFRKNLKMVLKMCLGI